MWAWESIPEGFYAVPITDTRLLGHVLWKREGYGWSRARYVPVDGVTQDEIQAADPDDDISNAHLDIPGRYVSSHLEESRATFEQLDCLCERCGEPLTSPYAKWAGLDAVCLAKVRLENTHDTDDNVDAVVMLD